MYWRPGDLALCLKKRPKGLQSNKRLDKQGRKAHKGKKNQTSEPQAWLPTPILNSEPLRDNASIRDFHGGNGCHVASALEEALLVSTDITELWSIKRHEVFLNLKRYLGMVYGHPPFFFLLLFIRLLTFFFQAVQATFRVEEITNSYYRKLDNKRTRRVAAVESFNIADRSNKDLRNKLKDEEQARRSAKSALEGAQKQAEDLRLLLRDIKEQLASSKEQIAALRKKLEEV